MHPDGDLCSVHRHIVSLFFCGLQGPPSDGSIGFKLVRTNTETDTEAVASSTTDTAATSTAIDEA